MLMEYQEKIMELLQQMEMDISRFYKLLADKYPRYRDLWNSLSQQEIDHADRVDKLHDLAKQNRVLFDEKQTKTVALKTILDGIKNSHKKAQSNEMTLINALSVSHDLEQSIIEKDLYKHFAGNDQETQMLIDSIREDTLMHQSSLNAAWEKEKKNLGKG